MDRNNKSYVRRFGERRCEERLSFHLSIRLTSAGLTSQSSEEEEPNNIALFSGTAASNRS